MKTLKVNIVSNGRLLGCKGDRVKVLEKCGDLFVVQGVKTGRKAIIKSVNLQ